VHNILFPDICFDTTSFTLLVTENPVNQPQNPTDYNLCDDTSVGTDTDGIINHFLLNTKDAQILGALNAATYNVSYHTTLVGAQTDNVTDVIDKNNGYTNTIVNSQPIFVRVENVNNAACNDTSKSFNIVVNPLPVIANNVELKQCDNDVDGFAPFNLFEVATDISANHSNETFTFFPSIADAVADTNVIPNPTTFINRVIPSDIVWARATSSFGCYRISEVTLTVSTTGIPAGFVRPFTTCDDFLDINGNDNGGNNDTDGIATFNFSSVTAEIVAIFPVNQQLTVTYYRNQADAFAEQNAINDIVNYRNIGYPNYQDIYVRVDSDLDNDCLGFGVHVTLTVDPNPTATTIADYELCDNLDDGDGFNGIIQSFDLESRNATILGSQNPANYTVTYHRSAADANTGLNNLSSPFTNEVANTQPIFVRVTNNNAAACFTDHTSFNIVVNPLPVANFADDIEICDDNSDGSARNGFSQSINLEDNTATVLGGQDPAIFSVTYHKSLANAQAGLLPLVSPYTNTIPYRETIYVRVYNADTGCANGISNFDVIVNPEPIPNAQNTLSNLSYCDDDDNGNGDDTDGILENVDLDSQIPDILGPDNTLPNYQDPDDYTVTFHHNQADASSGDNPIASPYTNTNRSETIFVRILNKATNCINDDLTFNLIINALPDFQITTPQIVCLNILPKNIITENPNDVYTYQWVDGSGTVVGTDPTLNVSVGGLYTITATSTNGSNCTRSRSIQVNESIIATFVEDDITIVDDSDNNTITIDNINDHLGIGDYQYALTDLKDNIIRPYQDELIFENLDGEIYKVLVRDKNGCGTVSLSMPVVVFPEFFTPNNDGYNDVWEIKGVNELFFPISEVFIFDRFGKTVAQIKINGKGWDGSYNGRALPSDDYWFSIILVDINGVKRERKGNFSMLRK
jgi:gliding motility-associated-like protein